MTLTQRFPFVETDDSLGDVTQLPYAAITLGLRGRSVSVPALLDTGSTVNVLPFDVGSRLGAVWEQQTVPIRLAGPLAQDAARAVLLEASMGELPSVRLAFAWTRSNAVPVILGQVNFFKEFDVCFFRSRSQFEVRVKGIETVAEEFQK